MVAQCISIRNTDGVVFYTKHGTIPHEEAWLEIVLTKWYDIFPASPSEKILPAMPSLRVVDPDEDNFVPTVDQFRTSLGIGESDQEKVV